MIRNLTLLSLVSLLACGGGARTVDILNVSFDPTRELYSDLDEAFTKKYERDHGIRVNVRQSHGGSGKQARAVLEGLDADVVTLGLGYDVDVLAEHRRLLPRTWQSRLPHASTPFTSTIVFVVRGGNPHHIRGWDDLVRPGVSVIAPSPKTSGGARWIYLAAWAHARRASGGTDASARAFVQTLYGNVPVLDSGARGASTTFARNGLGDVLLSWEAEALLFTRDRSGGDLELVTPGDSVLAEPPVALVDANVDRHGTRVVAQAYLDYLFTDEAQEIAARNYFRPTSAAVLARHRDRFPELHLFDVQELFGGWQNAQRVHFAEGGIFDQIYQPH